MLIKRKINGLLALICVFIIFLSTPVNAAEKLRIKSDGLFINLTNEPIKNNDTTMIAVTDYSRILKAKAVWDRTTKTATIRKHDLKLEINVLTGDAYLNGEKINILPNPVINNEIAYLPLKTVCEIFDVKVSLNDSLNIISINTNSNYLTLDTGSIIDEGTAILTYDEAVKKAITANNSLKNLNDNVELIEKSLEMSGYSLDTAFLMPYSNYIQLIRQVNSLENSLSSIPLSQKMTEDLAKLMVFNSATSIESIKLDIKLLEESIVHEEQNIKNLELKNKLGLVSDNDIKTAKISLDLNKTNLELLNISLNAEYQALNQILKKDLKAKTIVLYEPDITKFNVANIDGFIENKIKEAPTIKIKEINLEQAEYKKNTSSYSIDETGIDLITTENDYKAAERDLYDAKLDLEKTIRSLFNNLKQLEGKEKTLELDLEKAINNYNNAVTNYEAGNVIMYQVEQARLGIFKVEIDIQKNRIAYDSLKFLLNNPYLSASNSGK